MSYADRMKLLQSPKAIVATRHIHGEAGGATVYCVVLADGFLLECGSDGWSSKRAILLAETINAGDPKQFNFAANWKAA